MGRLRRRKCRHCQELFNPDYRNRNKQRYCSALECRKASKAAGQKKWLQKAENKNYFRGPENVRRVQEWRKKNPEYWKNRQKKPKPLQDHLFGNNEEKRDDRSKLTKESLQDLLTHYPTVLVGLLAHLSGSPLQDDIVRTSLHLQQLGNDILTEPSSDEGGRHDSRQKPHTAAPDPKDTGTVQLGRSPACP